MSRESSSTSPSSEPWHLLRQLAQRLRDSRGFEDHEDAVQQAALLLDIIGPLATVVLDAIHADRSDCVLAIGAPGRKRWVTAEEAVMALQKVLMQAGEPSRFLGNHNREKR